MSPGAVSAVGPAGVLCRCRAAAARGRHSSVADSSCQTGCGPVVHIITRWIAVHMITRSLRGTPPGPFRVFHRRGCASSAASSSSAAADGDRQFYRRSIQKPARWRLGRMLGLDFVGGAAPLQSRSVSLCSLALVPLWCCDGAAVGFGAAPVMVSGECAGAGPCWSQLTSPTPAVAS